MHLEDLTDAQRQVLQEDIEKIRADLPRSFFGGVIRSRLQDICFFIRQDGTVRQLRIGCKEYSNCEYGYCELRFEYSPPDSQRGRV